MEHMESELFSRFNIEFVEDGLENEIDQLNSTEDSMFGDYSFGYYENEGMSMAGYNPDRLAALGSAESVIISNDDYIRGVYNDAVAYRTYGQSVSFVGIIDADGGERAQLLATILDELAGYEGSLTGNIVEAGTSIPVPNATVIFQDCGITLQSDEDGYFEFTPFPNEEFLVIVQASGFELTMQQFSFNGEESVNILIELQTLGVQEPENKTVSSFTLDRVFPNPFNSTTTVDLTVDRTSTISLDIFDLSGKLIMNVGQHDLNPGSYSIPVTLADIPAGMYLLNMSDGERRSMKKIMLLR